MLQLGRRVLHLDIGDGMGAALVADEQGVALGKVLGSGGAGHNFDQAPVSVLALTGGDTLGDDGAAGVLAQVNHLGAGVGLLVVVDQGHRVKLADGIVALQDDAGVFPGDGRAGFHLSPGDF